MKTVLALVDMTLTCLEGHTAVIVAGVPKEVPEELVLEAMRRGCKVMSEDETKPVVVAADPASDAPESRREKIRTAIMSLLADGDPNHFKTDGTPKAGAVSKLVGETVGAADVYDLWSEMQMDEEIKTELAEATSES